MTQSAKHIPKVPKALLANVGHLIALARKVRQWRQADLAQRLDVTRQTVARMEQGDPTVSAGIYFSGAWILDVPILAGMDARGEGALTQFIALLSEVLPQRSTAPLETTIDDQF